MRSRGVARGLRPSGHRRGRARDGRRVLISATATFGLFTLCTARAATLQQILLLRFLAGVGFGGAMPSFISLATEYTPRSNTAGGGWAAVDGSSARRGDGRITRVTTDRCGWLAVVVLYRRHFAARSVDRDDPRTARAPHIHFGGLPSPPNLECFGDDSRRILQYLAASSRIYRASDTRGISYFPLYGDTTVACARRSQWPLLRQPLHLR